MKEHVTSLELSKKLKELGFPQNSEFYWYQVDVEDYPDEGTILRNEKGILLKPTTLPHERRIAAYLATELGEWLPSNITIENYKFINAAFEKDKCGWYGELSSLECKAYHIKLKNLSNAMATMLIYLAENNIIDPKTL